MDILECLEAAFASTGRVMAKVQLDRLDDPTPCADWDVRGLINHVTGTVATIAAVAARGAPPQVTSIDWGGTDPAAFFDEAAKNNASASDRLLAFLGRHP